MRSDRARSLWVGLILAVSAILGSMSALAFGGGGAVTFNIDKSYAEASKINPVYKDILGVGMCASYVAKSSGRTTVSKTAYVARVRVTMYTANQPYGVPAYGERLNSDYAYAYTTATRLNILCAELLETKSEHSAKETQTGAELVVYRNQSTF